MKSKLIKCRVNSWMVSLGRRGGWRAQDMKSCLPIPLFLSLFFPFPPLHPTPPLSTRLLPHPFLLTPLSAARQRHLFFCMKGVYPMNNPVVLYQNKPVGEGSASQPGRLEQQGEQPLVISSGSGSAACLDPHIHCLAAFLPD